MAFEHAHSIPWTDDELARVNGISVVYSFDKHDGFIFHLPGGRSVPEEALLAEFKRLELPRKVRHEADTFA